MPAKSVAQQRLMGMALSYKRNSLDKKDMSPELIAKIKEVASKMSSKELEDFAKTKHKDLPKHVPENVNLDNVNGMGDVTLPTDNEPGSGDLPKPLFKKVSKLPKLKNLMNFEQYIETINEITISPFKYSKYFNNDNFSNDLKIFLKEFLSEEKYKKLTPKDINNGGDCHLFALAFENRFKGNYKDVKILDDKFFVSIIEKQKLEDCRIILKKEAFKKYNKGILPKEGQGFDNHVWIYFKGKHYDIECINGVTNFMDLPYFKRKSENPYFIKFKKELN